MKSEKKTTWNKQTKQNKQTNKQNKTKQTKQNKTKKQTNKQTNKTNKINKTNKTKQTKQTKQAKQNKQNKTNKTNKTKQTKQTKKTNKTNKTNKTKQTKQTPFRITKYQCRSDLHNSALNTFIARINPTCQTKGLMRLDVQFCPSCSSKVRALRQAWHAAIIAPKLTSVVVTQWKTLIEQVQPSVYETKDARASAPRFFNICIYIHIRIARHDKWTYLGA